MVAIKGMNMPASCKVCMLNNVHNAWFSLCRTTGYNVIEYKDSRHPNCPLVEIVTCKDCKYCYENSCDFDGWGVNGDYFCAKGERGE